MFARAENETLDKNKMVLLFFWRRIFQQKYFLLQRIEPADAHVLEKYLQPTKMANGD